MTYTTAFCEREYNNRALVPEHPAIFARWTEAGRAARERGDALLDLPYGGSARQRLDLFPSHRGASGPLLVFVHGGYWRSLDKAQFAWIAPPFAERGISVALLGYDLAPAVGVDAIVLQVLRGLEWLWRNADTFGYDPNRIVVSGHSAGAHLTAMAMRALWPRWDPDLPADLVKAGVAISGLYDLEPLLHTPFVNVDLKLDARSALKLSPAWMPPATGAPLVTAVGALESSEFVRQNRLLGERWPRNLRRDVPMPGANHFTVVDALGDPASPLFEATIALCLGR
jgi:arylformamidase